MDPITHSLTGAMLAQSSRLDRDLTVEQKRFWFWALVIAAEFPDVDVLLLPFNISNNLLFYHRSFTHSFLGALIQALALAWFIRFEIKESFWKIFGITSLVFSSHVLADWSTSYGTPIFAPFSWKPYSLDWVSNLTLVPLAIFMTAVLISKLKPRLRFQVVYTGWALFIIFLGISAAFHQRAIKIIGENGVAAMPHPLFPTQWYGIESFKDGHEFRTYSISVITGSKELIGRYGALAKFKKEPWMKNILQSAEFKRYQVFNRWPVAKIKKAGATRTVNIGNLLFRWHEKGVLVHSLQFEIDREGKILSFHKSQLEPD